MSKVKDREQQCQSIEEKDGFLSPTVCSSRSRSKRAKISPCYNLQSLLKQNAGGKSSANENNNKLGTNGSTNQHKHQHYLTKTKPPTKDPCGRGGYYGNRSKMSDRKGIGQWRGSEQDQRRRSKPITQAAREAKMMTAQKHKLQAAYRTGKQRGQKHAWLAALVIDFLTICIVAKTTTPRYLSLGDAFNEAAERSAFQPTSGWKVRKTYYNWLHSGMLYFEPYQTGRYQRSCVFDDEDVKRSTMKWLRHHLKSRGKTEPHMSGKLFMEHM